MHADDGFLLLACAALGQFQRDVAMGVAPRIFQQVADQPAQQPGRALQRQAVVRVRSGSEFCHQLGIDARAFLCGQPRQVQRLERFGVGLLGVQPAGQQDFIDQLVQLGNASRYFHALGRRLVHAHQFEPHADARQRRAQFVRGIGQQRLVRLHQRLDALGGVVEAPRQESHLVAAFGVDARRQVARAPALHAALQGLQPQRQAPHDGVGTQRHGQPDQSQHPAKAKRRAIPGVARRPLGPGQQQVQRLAVGGHHVKFDVFAALAVGFGLGLADDFAGGVVHQHFTDRQLGLITAELPGSADQERQHHDGGHYGQPDAHIQVRGEP